MGGQEDHLVGGHIHLVARRGWGYDLGGSGGTPERMWRRVAFAILINGGVVSAAVEVEGW